MFNCIYIYASVCQYDPHLHSVCDKPYFVDGIRGGGWAGHQRPVTDPPRVGVGGREMSDIYPQSKNSELQTFVFKVFSHDMNLNCVSGKYVSGNIASTDISTQAFQRVDSCAEIKSVPSVV